MTPLRVTLRDVQPADVPTLFSFECDPAWCAMAMVKPRAKPAFEAVWEKIFSDRAAGLTGPALGIVQKAILADGPNGPELCGSIGCRLVEGRCAVGYGLGPAHWGRGIASRALALILAEVPVRPLHARVATTNAASLRVLMKHGFVIESTRAEGETDRYVACDVANLVLV